MTNPTTIDEDGVVISDAPEFKIDANMVSQLVRAEIDTAVATARMYPRVISTCLSELFQIVTIDEETAEECMYALKRRGKDGDVIIDGPSIRFAEAVQAAWGNCSSQSIAVEVNKSEGYVEARGAYKDFQKNTIVQSSVRRNIKTAKGFVFSSDMITVTMNAAQSIAKRNAILAGVPKNIWNKAYKGVLNIVRGTEETLGQRRIAAIKAFSVFGIDKEIVFKAIGVKSIEDVTLDHIPQLRGFYTSLRDGESAEKVFGTGKADETHEVVKNPLADEEPNETRSADNGEADEAAARAQAKAEQEAAAKAAGAQKPAAATEQAAAAETATQPAKRGPGRPKKETEAKPAETAKAGFSSVDLDDEEVVAAEADVPALMSQEEMSKMSVKDYDNYVREVINSHPFGSAAELGDWWKSGRNTRIAVRITPEVFEALKDYFMRRGNERFPD